MGQKVNPIGLRLGINKGWSSKWFAEKKYGDLVHQDIKLRKFLKKKFYHAGISKIEIERAADKAKVNIHAARPGIIIGKKGSEIEKLKKDLDGMTGGETIINIMEVRKPEIDAQLVAENVALQLERRIAFRRAMKKSVTSALKFGAKGIRITCSGRLGGARDVPDGVVPRGESAPAHPAGRHRLRLCRGADDLRGHRHQGAHLSWGRAARQEAGQRLGRRVQVTRRDRRC